MSESDLIYKADRAKALLDDPLLKEAFDALEKGAIEALLALPPSHDVDRLHYANMVNTIRGVRTALTAHITRAEHAARGKLKVA